MYSPLSNCRGSLINRGVGSPPDIGNFLGGGNKLKWVDICEKVLIGGRYLIDWGVTVMPLIANIKQFRISLSPWEG